MSREKRRRDAHQYKEHRHEHGRGERYNNLSRAIKRGEAGPDAHAEEGKTCCRLNSKRLFSGTVPDVYHGGIPIEAVEQGKEKHH